MAEPCPVIGLDGEVQKDSEGDPYVDSVFDPDEQRAHWKKWCTICLCGVLPTPHSSWLQREPVFHRIFAFTRVLTDEERARALAYFASPACTFERHRWYEEQELANAREAERVAMAKVAELVTRVPGWSLVTEVPNATR